MDEATRTAQLPYVRCMLTLRALYCSCGVQVSAQGAIGITSPGWMSLPALMLYHACAAHLAAVPLEALALDARRP